MPRDRPPCDRKRRKIAGRPPFFHIRQNAQWAPQKTRHDCRGAKEGFFALSNEKDPFIVEIVSEPALRSLVLGLNL
jgi:hypothetical protein